MVGTDDAVCVDRRAMGSGDIAGVRGAEVEVLKLRPSSFTVYDMVWYERKKGISVGAALKLYLVRCTYLQKLALVSRVLVIFKGTILTKLINLTNII